MTDQTKLLWHSNAPWAPTGYGNQTALFTPLLAQEHDVTISAYFGLDGAPLNWSGLNVLPGAGGEFGNVSLIPHATDVFGTPRGGTVLTLMDVWVLDATVCGQLNMASWCPVDHDPVPPDVREFFYVSKAQPIAMSRFGEEQLAGFDPLYVPHGVDTSVYKPGGGDMVRETWGLDEDAFVVGIVAANKGRPSRKAFSESLQALAHFMQRRENAYLYLHTMLNPSFAAGENLPALIEALEIPQDRLIVTSQYRSAFHPVPAEAMAGIYSAMDVLLNPAHGEGFGITPLEAQACGTPVIVQDFTAMTEVAGAGWHVNGSPVWTGQKSWQRSPHVQDIIGALDECYTAPAAKRAALSRQAREHAEGYSHLRVFDEHWRPTMAALEDRFQAEAPVTIPARVAA